MKARGTITKVKGNQALIRLDTDKMKPGQDIEVKIGKKRTTQQNSFLWLYYSYVCEKCDLWKDHCFTPEGLHSAMKKHFLSQKELKQGKFKVFFTGSSTDLTKLEMAEFITKIDNFITDFFKIDTSHFFKDYETFFASY